MDYTVFPFLSEGIIFGKGTGALKGAKIMGTTSGIHIPTFGNPEVPTDPLPIITILTREGTITGWTGLP